ncbi:MAG TPA: hypothetical protein VGQ17_04460 [Gemmatimonadales bacterium]|jgi:hypothetical protein|nr:hypothetical protein [Gemmatimonadales bacterium]
MKPSLVLALLVAGAGPAVAQGTPAIKFEDLRAPSSPTFVLMGIEPKSIERPKTPRAFVLSAIQAARESSGIPRNYAMEFAPFWLVPHPKLQFRPDQKQSAGATLLQTLAFSVATATDSGSAHTTVGFGVRALVARGGVPQLARELLDSMRTIQKRILETDDTAEEDRLVGLLKPLALQLQPILYSTGFRFEVAAAAMGRFDDGEYSTGQFSRLGVWVTPSYEVAHPKLDVSGVLRLIVNRGNRSGSAIDYGTRVSYDFESLTFAYELVGRATIDATITTSGPPGPTTGTFTLNNTYRSAGSLEYKLGAGSSVSFTFGRNFTEVPDEENLIASVSLNLGFGSVPLVSLNK